MDAASLYASIRPRYPELSGGVAVVTGSSRNIGRGIAMRLGREGMRVVINGRTAKTVEATTAELSALGVEVLAVPAPFCSVSSTKVPAMIYSLFAELVLTVPFEIVCATKVDMSIPYELKTAVEI